ncbi:MAG: hypothetical protein AB8C46_23565 [Burkholderiaceae bacterium]
MNQTHPGAAPDRSEDVAGSGVERADTPETDVQAKGEAQAAAVAAAREAGDIAEGDLQAMTEHVMDKADLEAGTCFGVPVPEDMLPVEVARLLCQLKAAKGLPLENLPDAMVGPLLLAKIDNSGDLEQADNTEAIAKGRVETTDNYADWRAQFSTNAEAVLAVDTLETGGNPKLEAVKQRLLGFRRILTVVQQVGNEADTAIVTARLAQVDLTNPPEPISFARAFLFDSPNSDEGSGLSDAAQAAIAAELGITLPPSEPKTGGDANDIYERGAIETYIDPDTGDQRERRVPLPKDQRVPFAEEAELGFDSVGNRTAFVQTKVGPYQTELPKNATDRDIGDILRTVQLRAKLHELNIAHMFFPDVTLAERGGGEMVVHPWHRDITEQFLGTVVGNRALAGNHLLSQSDLDKIPYLMQFHDRKGDYGIADVNPEQTVEDYRTQEIVDKSGVLNWDRFTALVMANRANLYTEANFATQALDEPA